MAFITLQQKIINELNVSTTINPAQEIEKRVKFIMEYLLDSNAEGLLLGISGGQDSTLTGKLCQLAINKLNTANNFISPKKFIALRQPYGIQIDAAAAELALNFIQPDEIIEFNIKAATDLLVTQTNELTTESIIDFVKGNLKARLRMVVQYLIAGQQNLLVVGTDHAAEAVTGFFTKYGDGAVDLTPLSGLTKRQGKKMLAYLNAPEQLLIKIPTADLEDNKPQLPDEIALGVSYEDIDNYLENQSVNLKTKNIIESLYLASQHKRKLPVTPFDKWQKTN